MRMIAGPNGSGKSTLLERFAKIGAFRLGFVLNPDEVEGNLRKAGRLSFGAFGCEPSESELRHFFSTHVLTKSLQLDITVKRNVLYVERSRLGGYFTAVLCEFLRSEWLMNRAAFTFETVMSHKSKLDILREARARGYRTYLYFVCTDDAEINRRRVLARMQDGGHDVPPEKIASRYARSLKLLPQAISLCDRAYLFDNSGTGAVGHRWVAELEQGNLVGISKQPPAWVVRALRLDRAR